MNQHSLARSSSDSDEELAMGPGWRDRDRTATLGTTTSASLTHRLSRRPRASSNQRSASIHSVKRSFDQLTPPSTASTSSSSTDEGRTVSSTRSSLYTSRPTPLSTRPRHTPFDTQELVTSAVLSRARVSDERVGRSSGIFRRRSIGAERDRFKRRRALDDEEDDTVLPNTTPPLSATTMTTTFAPALALGRFPARSHPVDPVLTSDASTLPSFTDMMAATTPPPNQPSTIESSWNQELSSSFSSPLASSAQLSHEAVFLPSANSTTSTHITTAPTPPMRWPMRNRTRESDAARQSRAEVSFHEAESSLRRQSRENDRLGRDILAQANEILGKAEETLRRANTAEPFGGRRLLPRLRNGNNSGNSMSSGSASGSGAEAGQSTVDADIPLPTLPSVRHLLDPDRANETLSTVSVRIGEGWSHPRTGPSIQPFSLTSTSTRRPRFPMDSTTRAAASTSASTFVHATNRARANVEPWDEAIEIEEARRLNTRLLARRNNRVDWTGEARLTPSSTSAPSNTTTTAPSSSTASESNSNLWGEPLDRSLWQRAPILRPRLSRSSSSFAPPQIDTTTPTMTVPRVRFGHPFSSIVTPPPSLAITPNLGSHDPSGSTETSPFARRSSPSPVRRSLLWDTMMIQNTAEETANRRRVGRRVWFADDNSDEEGEVEEEGSTTSNRQVNSRLPPLPPVTSTRSAGDVGVGTGETGRSTSSGSSSSIFDSRGGAASSSARHSSRSFLLPTRSQPTDEGGRRHLLFPHPNDASGESSISADLAAMRRSHPGRAETEAFDRIDRMRFRPFGSSSALEHRSRQAESRATELAALYRDRRALRDFFGTLEAREASSSSSSSSGHNQARAELTTSSSTMTTSDSLSALARLSARTRRGMGGVTGFSDYFLRHGMFDEEEDGFADDVMDATTADSVSARGRLSRYFDSVALDPRNYLPDESFDTSYESLLRLSERLGDVVPRLNGISPTHLNSLRRFKYREWPHFVRRVTRRTGVASSSAVKLDDDEDEAVDAGGIERFAVKGTEKEERCAVCLTDYEEDDECMLSSECRHGFHEECLTAWLKSKGNCPICRSDQSQ